MQILESPFSSLFVLFFGVCVCVFGGGRGEGGVFNNELYLQYVSAITMISLLDSQIRMIIDKFGRGAVRIAWHDPNQVTEHVLNGYTKVT